MSFGSAMGVLMLTSCVVAGVADESQRTPAVEAVDGPRSACGSPRTICGGWRTERAPTRSSQLTKATDIGAAVSTTAERGAGGFGAVGVQAPICAKGPFRNSHV